MSVMVLHGASIAIETHVPPALFVPVIMVVVMAVEPELVPALVLPEVPILNWLL
jgi:hypothetical protein